MIYYDIATKSVYHIDEKNENEIPKTYKKIDSESYKLIVGGNYRINDTKVKKSKNITTSTLDKIV